MVSLGGDIFVLCCIVNYQRDSFSEFTSEYFPFFLLSVNDIRFMTKNIERSSYAFRETNEEIYDYDSGENFVPTHPISVRTTLVCQGKIICNLMFIGRLQSCFIKYFDFTWYEVGLWDE